MSFFFEPNTSSVASRLERFAHVLDQARPEVTVWGSRTVILGKEVLDLNQIAEKVNRTIREEKNWTQGECVAGKKIIEKLRSFYQLTDEQITQADFFMRLVVWIREVTMSNCRGAIENKNKAEKLIGRHLQNATNTTLEARRAEHRRWLTAHNSHAIHQLLRMRDMQTARVAAGFEADEIFDIENDLIGVPLEPDRSFELPLLLVENPSANDCTVCMDPLNNGDPVVAHSGQGGAQHPLHRECMWRSLLTTDGDCPFCRTEIY